MNVRDATGASPSWWLFASVMACSLLIAPPLSADDEEAGGDEPVALDRVQVTATRVARPVDETAAAITLVDEEDIRRQAPGVVAEALRGRPGTFFQQTTPGQGIPIVRGLKGSQVLHLVDGLRLNNAFFRSAPNQYLALVDGYATDRIEVVRGSAPSLYGADAMGGVVQLLTAEPAFTSAGRSAGGRLYGSWDSAERAFVTRAGGVTAGERSVLSGGVTWQDAGDRRTARGTVAPSGWTSYAGDLKWRQRLGATGELMLQVQALEQPGTPRIDELVPGFGQPEPPSAEFWFEPNRRTFYHARWRARPWFGFDEVEVHAARQVITDDRRTRDSGSAVRNLEANESTLDQFQLEADRSFGAFRVIAGLEWTSDEITSSRLLQDIDEGTVTPGRGRFPDGAELDSVALFGGAEWQGERWTVGGGLRWSDFDITVPATDISPAGRLQPDDLTGDAHATFDLSDDWRLVANVGRGFRPPNIFDIGTLGPRPGNRFNVPNADLGPESVWSYDLGLKHATPVLQAELFVFFLDYRDRITTVFTGETTADGRDIVRSENRSEVELYGLEAGLRWRATADLAVDGALNLTRGEETEEPGITVPADRVPPVNGRVGATWWAAQNWRVEPFVLFAADQDRLSPRDAGDPRIDPDGTDGWVTLNVNLDWVLRDDLTLGLRLENLTDEAYREHGSGIDAPGRSVGLWFNATL